MNIHTGKDFNGTELHIGDKVAFIARHIRSLSIGKVIGFTPKMIAVEYMGTKYNFTTSTHDPHPMVIMREVSYVVKVE